MLDDWALGHDCVLLAADIMMATGEKAMSASLPMVNSRCVILLTT